MSIGSDDLATAIIRDCRVHVCEQLRTQRATVLFKQIEICQKAKNNDPVEAVRQTVRE
jgi:hypothetical protein